MRQFEVAVSEAGMRADRFVQSHCELSRVDVASLFAAGLVRVDGRRVAKGARLEVGQVVSVDAAEEALQMGALPDPSVPLRIVFEDDTCVVVDKPAGLPCHPLRASERGCLANGLLARYPELSGVGYEPRQPGLVNRIDNDTSGLVLVARSQSAFQSLRADLGAGRIHKRYVALCASEPGQRRIELELAPDPRDPQRVVYRGERPDLQCSWSSASTEVREVTAWLGMWRVEVQVHTARRHQVRAHLAAVGAPIVGDARYGGGSAACGHHLLHASYLALTHPVEGRPVVVRSEPPEQWEEWIRTGSESPPGP